MHKPYALVRSVYAKGKSNYSRTKRLCKRIKCQDNRLASPYASDNSAYAKVKSFQTRPGSSYARLISPYASVKRDCKGFQSERKRRHFECKGINGGDQSVQSLRQSPFRGNCKIQKMRLISLISCSAKYLKSEFCNYLFIERNRFLECENQADCADNPFCICDYNPKMRGVSNFERGVPPVNAAQPSP